MNSGIGNNRSRRIKAVATAACIMAAMLLAFAMRKGKPGNQEPKQTRDDKTETTRSSTAGREFAICDLKTAETVAKERGQGSAANGDIPAPEQATAGDARTMAIQAPSKQVILVTREELETGVKVDLLKAWMVTATAGENPKSIEFKDLTISVNGSSVPEMTNRLLAEVGKDYYCRSLINHTKEAPKYFIDGKFSLERKDVLTVRFADPQHEAWIVVDEKQDGAIVRDLKFSIREAGPICQLSGALAEWIRSVNNVGNDLQDLQLLVNRAPEPTPVLVKEATIANLPNRPMSADTGRFLPLNRAEEAKLQQVMDFISKTKAGDRTEAMCRNLMMVLEETLGRSFASKTPGTDDTEFDDGENSTDTRRTLIEYLKQTLKLEPNSIQRFHEEWRKASEELAAAQLSAHKASEELAAEREALRSVGSKVEKARKELSTSREDLLKANEDLKKARMERYKAEHELARGNDNNLIGANKELVSKLRENEHTITARMTEIRSLPQTLQALEKKLAEPPSPMIGTLTEKANRLEMELAGIKPKLLNAIRNQRSRFFASIGECILTHRALFGLQELDPYENMFAPGIDFKDEKTISLALELSGRFLHWAKSGVEDRSKGNVVKAATLCVVTKNGRVLFEGNSSGMPAGDAGLAAVESTWKPDARQESPIGELNTPKPGEAAAKDDVQLADPLKRDPPGTNAASTGLPGVPPPLSLYAPTSQVILVTREELAVGIQVELLKVLMDATLAGKRPDTIRLAHLSTMMTAAGRTLERAETELFLTQGAGENYYCHTGTHNERAPKYFTTGNFALADPNVMTVRLAYPKQNPEHAVWIVVDEKPGPCVVTDLGFSIRESGTHLKLSGELAEWIGNVEPKDKSLCLIDDNLNSVTVTIPEATVSGWSNWTPPQDAEKIFPLLQQAELGRMLAYVKEVAPKSAEQRNTRCNQLMAALQEACGRTYLSKILRADISRNDDADMLKRYHDRMNTALRSDGILTPELMKEYHNTWEKALNDLEKASHELSQMTSDVKSKSYELKRAADALTAAPSRYSDTPERRKREKESKAKDLKKKDDLQNQVNDMERKIPGLQAKEAKGKNFIANQFQQFCALLGRNILGQQRKSFGLDELDRYDRILNANGIIAGPDTESALQFCGEFLQKAVLTQPRKTDVGRAARLRVVTRNGRTLFEGINNSSRPAGDSGSIAEAASRRRTGTTLERTNSGLDRLKPAETGANKDVPAGDSIRKPVAPSKQATSGGTDPWPATPAVRLEKDGNKVPPGANTAGAGIPGTPPPSSGNAPNSQVILVTREDLKAGVKIERLKSLMDAALAGKKPETLPFENLPATTVDSVPEKRNLFLTDAKDRNYYCWRKINDMTEPRFFTDGKFALGRKDVMTVRFSGLQHETYIAVDEPSMTGILSDLKFRIEESGKTFKLSGTLAEWIQSVQPADKDLRLIVNRSSATTVSIPDAMAGMVPNPQNPPNLQNQSKSPPVFVIFPLVYLNRDEATLKSNLAEVRKDLDAYLALPLSMQTTANHKTREMKYKCAALMSTLEQTVGNTFVAKYTGNAGRASSSIQMTTESRDKIIADLVKTYKVDSTKLQDISNQLAKASGEFPKNSAAGKAEPRIKARTEDHTTSSSISGLQQQFVDALGVCVLTQRRPFGLTEFNAYAKVLESGRNLEEADVKSAVEFLTKFLNRSAAPNDPPTAAAPNERPREDRFAWITTLRVQTQKGRILFDATKE